MPRLTYDTDRVSNDLYTGPILKKRRKMDSNVPGSIYIYAAYLVGVSRRAGLRVSRPNPFIA